MMNGSLAYRRGLAALALAATTAVVACGAGDQSGATAADATSDTMNAAVAKDDDSGTTSDPFGVTLTSAEIANAQAWDDSGEEESDVDVDDGDTTAEFEKLPFATDDGSDPDAGASSLIGGSSLTTASLDAPSLGTESFITAGSASLLCSPSTSVRQAACWAKGKYKGNIKVAQMDGKIVEVTVYCQVQKGKTIAKRAGKTLTVNSGWRSVDLQRKLYALYKAGRGNVTAPPGASHHNCGHAIDFAGSARSSGWLRSNAPKLNFQYIAIKGETWHFENWAVGPKVPR